MEDYYWDIVNATGIGRYLTKRESKFIKRYYPQGRSITCLDIGGSGRFNELIDSWPCLIDIDPIPLHKSLHRGSMPILADGERLPLRTNCIDVILAIEVLHFFDVDTFLEEAFRVLKNDGRLLLVTGNRSSYKSLAQRIFASDKTYKITYSELRRKLQKTGLINIEAKGFNWIPARRASNNPLIPIFSSIESILQLEHLPSVSPWVFIYSEKRNNLG